MISTHPNGHHVAALDAAVMCDPTKILCIRQACSKPIDNISGSGGSSSDRDTDNSVYCSPACLYSDALDRHRRQSSALGSPSYLNASVRTDDSLQLQLQKQQQQPPSPPHISTSLLIRRGIDPWAAPDDIALRQIVGRMLAEALAVHVASPSNAENSWAIENEAYRLSYHSAYTADAMSASRQYYQHISMVLVSRLRAEGALVHLLAAGHMPPDILCRHLACG
ncbi:hypothetical protein DL89DRAFT_292844 [Linderina pennispora]|uniref:Uncharacterized protein n=1 Tax=Linderina pennispora TaxID=61395 RepID=A0A1Y1W9G7_9FUNG|nr:uncharacterized protein DL89DRAFT_292842 [Linderina pennispora]XP_040743819.1 uncharacterized protein DL89DRAFT_292844 [Linderina pennispora]ORX70179.1 hypothetical protein DL89DRAFT_292842 [Linderina pennispora]ORX70181.1 hypothetical protein DL89DRAFT_292844 [Linderina pennispora]